MSLIRIKHEGSFRMNLLYTGNNTTTMTDAPLSHNGLGEYPTPGVVLSEALAACALTTGCLYAASQEIETKGAYAEIEDLHVDHESNSINLIAIQFHFLKTTPTSARKRIEAHVTRGCTVGNTLKCEKKYSFYYDV